jgi:hypothetical protein
MSKRKKLRRQRMWALAYNSGFDPHMHRTRREAESAWYEHNCEAPQWAIVRVEVVEVKRRPLAMRADNPKENQR